MTASLSKIVAGLETVELVGPADIVVGDVTCDSRKVAKDSLFACIRGGRMDGHTFADDAVSRGASAILCDRRIQTAKPVTQVVVADVREALAEVSSAFFGCPSQALTVVGVTGTNGKTTTVHYLRSIIETWGQSAGSMGTLGHWTGDTLRKDPFTTPEAPEVHRYMRWMLDRGLKFCIMEVSSHAIALRRVDRVDFDVVVFTNLTRDHLDFHHDFAEYRKVKMKLFGVDDEGYHFGPGRKAAINIGDETGRLICHDSPLESLTFCLEGDADVRGDIVEVGWERTRLAVSHASRTSVIETSLIGRSNAENALASWAAARLLGIDEEPISQGIAALKRVPGRMEVITGPDRQAIVDYAHTPDALRRLLADVRHLSSGRIICVFGCGGDRDAGKRPEMGGIAAQLADITIVTSDNPRTEDPIEIIDQIVEGIPRDSQYETIPDRAQAIHRAAALARTEDIVVVAGKGHEAYQIVGTARVDFDDREVLRKAFGAVPNAQA